MKKIILFLFLILTINSYAQTALSDGALISRPCKNAPYLLHFGVMWCGKVTHYNETGLHISTLEEFAGTETVKIITKGMTGESLKQFKIRGKKLLEEYKYLKYDAMNNNCEHFATEMVFGIKKSLQSNSAKEYIQNYWPILKEKMLKENPKSQFYVQVLDAYFKKYMAETINNIHP